MIYYTVENSPAVPLNTDASKNPKKLLEEVASDMIDVQDYADGEYNVIIYADEQCTSIICKGKVDAEIVMKLTSTLISST